MGIKPIICGRTEISKQSLIKRSSIFEIIAKVYENVLYNIKIYGLI